MEQNHTGGWTKRRSRLGRWNTLATWASFAALLGLSALAHGDSGDVTILSQRPSLSTNASMPLVYWSEIRSIPRPLRIHVLQIDLRSKRHAMDALIADDPDDGGPAESQLEKPLSLATRKGVVAAVNANAFAAVPPPKEGERARWIERLPVDILGWARDATREASLPRKTLLSFWVDHSGRGHVGGVDTAVEARMAVAGFGRLLAAGKIDAAGDKPLHPRTALGLDQNGSTLWLVLVDGRQAGYSEGTTQDELAALMKEIGCWDAINLDGGGSSIMLLAKDGTNLSIMNRPSDPGTRPVPVMLGVRKVR